ncbi:hypothetical protein GPA19_07900 [Azoarcus indigens]|uniref:Uncharacterized protein n=1 Tax=Azoarcus indigens TaxID=29545 RepID=A0A4R6DYH4_9RHOO|nr:hypothetical protein [Azoarcus indigens]NMG64866.1 hypothetical protein [Azoarcus indigens]TDN50405.1 hypothetical protein C7389_10999 [Azoarcus indigens]
MEGTEKQVKWAQAIKAELMPAINALAEKSRKAAAGNPANLQIVEQVLACLEAKPASWWIDRRPFKGDGNVNAGAFIDCWREAATEIIKGK